MGSATINALLNVTFIYKMFFYLFFIHSFNTYKMFSIYIFKLKIRPSAQLYLRIWHKLRKIDM